MVAREGTIQRASELLHVTPASVSVQVRQLERSLGVRLFKKQGRGLVLTETGQQVAEYANEIFATGRELMEMIKGSPVGRPLELRVGIREVMPKLVAYQLLQPALLLEQPVRLVCQEGDMAELIADLAIHKLDLVLTDTALDPLYKVQAHSSSPRQFRGSDCRRQGFGRKVSTWLSVVLGWCPVSVANCRQRVAASLRSMV